MKMKSLVSAAFALLAAHGAWAGETAGLVGIMNTSGTVDVNNFVNPKVIWTVYNVNDPAEEAYVLAYVAYRKLGKHTPSIEWTDAANKPVDRCKFDPANVTKMPWVHTLTCKWGGRLPDGGIRFSVFNTFDGQKEKIGEMFIPPNSK